MNKGQLIVQIAEWSDISMVEAEEVLNNTIHIIKNQLFRGKEVKIKDFGTFKLKFAKARIYNNPQNNGKIVKRPATKRLRFLASEKLVKALNGKRL